MDRSPWRIPGVSAPRATVLVRLLVGCVFASEGVQKFLFPSALGVGRFVKIGIPAPELMAPFVAAVEISCGALVIFGLLTRLAVIPLIIDIGVAILSTKIPILLGRSYFLFSYAATTKPGFWSALHEARTDLSMLLTSIFLWLVGPGPSSLDARLLRRLTSPSAKPGGGAS